MKKLSDEEKEWLQAKIEHEKMRRIPPIAARVCPKCLRKRTLHRTGRVSKEAYGPPPEKSGWTVLKEAHEVNIRQIEFHGKPYLPIFSSLLRLQEFVQREAGYYGGGYIAINALEFLKITCGAELILILNLGSECGKVLTREEIQSIIDGSIWQTAEPYRIEGGTRVMIGQPSKCPHELADALKRLFAGLKQIRRAYLAQFFIPEKDEKPHTLIGIEVSGDWDKVLAQAGMVIRDVEIPDPPVDFMQITGEGGGAEDYFLNECQPFYKKRLLDLF